MAKHKNAQPPKMDAQPTHSRMTPRRTTGLVRSQRAYWKERVDKVQGRTAESPSYSIQIGHQNRRVRFPLNTSNKDNAAAKALAIFQDIERYGWDEALAKHKPKLIPQSSADFPSTVGGLIAAALSISSARPQTLDGYGKALRKIAGDIAGVKQKGKYAGRGRAAGAWQERVDRIPLDRIDRSSLLRWKNAYLKLAGDNAKAESAGVSFNSLRRNAKGLFPKKLRPHLADIIVLPEGFISAFEELPVEEERDLRYSSRVDADSILHEAKKQLAKPKDEAESEEDAMARHEQYKALLLCLVFGLRRSEADFLLWRQFNLEDGVLHIESNEYHRLKSKKSAGDITLPPGIAEILREFQSKALGEFVLESKNSPTRKGRGYRCNLTFKALLVWLRKNGVDSAKPIHTMRKEIGALIASQQGIYAASRYLRHSDIGITSRIYADQKEAVVAPLAAFGGDRDETIKPRGDAR